MIDYDLSERRSASLYEYLYRRIRDDIVSGAIAADERLPSKRQLAAHLGVSVITVEAAYAQLMAEGYVRSRPRSGYFANELVKGPERPAVVRAEAGERHGGEAPSACPKPLVDLTDGGGSGVEAERLWSRALRLTLAEEPEAELAAAAPAMGLPRLREAIAAHLRGSRGMVVSPDRIVVGAGAQQLDNMLVQLLGRDLVYAVEDPGYLRLTRIYQANGCRVRHIPLDASGPSMAALAEKGADVVHLMPSHQFPTGIVTTIGRRYELLAWAAESPSRLIVEDDYDCEFRLAGRPVPALAGIDTLGRVVYTNTFSRGLGAALRLAYMVLPGPLMEDFGSKLGFYSSTVGSIEQLALARVLEDGSYERHVARERKRHRDRRDALVGALEASAIADRLQVEEVDSGLHFVLAVDSDAGEAELAARASRLGLALDPLSGHAWCAENGARPDGLRRFVVRCGALDPERAPLAAELLAKAVL